MARQWTPQSPTWFDLARAELQRGSTGSDLTWGNVRIRAGDLPLFRRSPDGKLHQALRVAIDSPRELGPVTVAVSEGGRVADETTSEVAPGGQRLLLFLPERQSSRPVELAISDGSEQRLRATIEVHPQRKWSLFLIHQSHLDIGYTDPQPAVLRHHLAYLDSVLDLAAATDEWPDPARFRWNVEATWPLRHWLSTRPPPVVDSFMDRVRAGRVEITALPFSMHTEAYSIDELARQLWFADELRERHGVRIDTAMQTDVPGATAGLLQVLADADVRFLSVAHNYAGRSVPHLVGGQQLTRPFYWTGDSGDRICVWFTDTPHGLAYMEGNMLGLADDYETAVELVPEYLAALAQRPYPYAEPVFGWPGPPRDAEVTKRPYAHDILHLRVQGAFADNAPPSLVPSEIVRRWSSEWAYPQLRVATNRDFFAVIEDRLAGSLDEFGGDWTDWWADGIGSDARALGFNRRAQAGIRSAQTLHALADGLPREGSVGHGWWQQVDAAYEDMALFDEHTWGAANPWEDRLDRMDSGTLQQHRKAAFAYAAWDRVERLTEAGLQRLLPLWGTSGPDLGAVVVVNPASAARSDVVTVFLPESRFGGEVAVDVVDAATGEVMARVVEEQDHAAHRPRGRHLSFVARDVPPLGYAMFRLRPGGPEQSAAGPVLDETSIENEYYRLEFDTGEGCVAHVRDKRSGVDLVRSDAPFGFNGYIYDRYGTAPHFNHLSSRIRAVDLSLLGSRSVGGGGVATHSSTPVWDRLTVRQRGEGAHWIETVLTLLHGVKRLDITNRLHKIETASKESAFFAFPFNIREPDVTYEITGGTTRPSGPFVPGSARHMRAVGHWVAFKSPHASIAWATREAPLVQLGNLFLPYAPFPPTLERDDGATVYSWILNNIWDTNFPSSQQGEMEFRYAVASDAADDAAQLSRETATSLTAPLLAVLAKPLDSARLPARGSFCRISRPDAEIVALTRSRRGHDLVVWLHAHVTNPSNVTLSFPLLPVAHAWKGTHLERRLEEVPVEGGEVQIGVRPGELSTLSVRLAAILGS